MANHEMVNPNDPLPTSSVINRGIRTFKPRRSRITPSQVAAIAHDQGHLVQYAPQPLPEVAQWPAPSTPLYLDIGFGNGVSTIALARANPGNAYLAIDVHTPGVGDLLSEIQSHQLTNIRVMESDSLAVLEHMITPNSLAGIYSLFPDPWQKARHHKRRLVQPAIVDLVHSRLAQHAIWHIATDWQEYADQIMDLFNSPTEASRWTGGIIERPDRPVTRYEQRAIRDHRKVTDFAFRKN
jgi:tRNA (guanine-N7-)-methyltransferase